ncbi:uncharacterized protein EV420DRAFT_595207 [Desarmillaria tabescens]|uniref:Uncharacterized protein n=1 Tax=Armillaria tabescens TaxID=1929756 RepID=A0AA39K6M9_ARMTA|nr:uncharacterized protein EV420DRAFT_595207 [Desarmillaria tabescens]KAK0455337.1 hypothetical protein EV420DRAFT_595207 [Desarmillaria tabescens]
MVLNPSDQVSLTSSDGLARWLHYFLSIRLEMPADRRALRSGNPEYHGMKVKDMIKKDFGSQDQFQRYLKVKSSNLRGGLGNLNSLDDLDKYIKMMETEIRKPLNNFLDCVTRVICAESAVLAIIEKAFSLYSLDGKWQAMKELNRLFASSHPWLKDVIYSRDNVSDIEQQEKIKNILNDYDPYKNTSHPQPNTPQEIRIAPMSPHVDQPGYRALSRADSPYPSPVMPRGTVNRPEQQTVANHMQATPRLGSMQPRRTPREDRATTPSATDVPQTTDGPETDWGQPKPPDRGQRETVSRPMSASPRLHVPREQSGRMVPYPAQEMTRRAGRRSEQSPLSSQNHTEPSKRPEIPTRGSVPRTRAPLKHASSHVRGAAPAAPMDDVETTKRNINGPAITDQERGSYLKGTDRHNDGSDGHQNQPQSDGLPPEPYGHGNGLNRCVA